MLFRSLTGTNRKAKPFSFTPRYYDADKEEFEERYARIEAELKRQPTISNYTSGHNLKEKWQRNKKTSNFEKKSNIRLVFITVLLVALCYWILY